VPELAVEGDLELEDALVVEDVSELDPLREAFEQGRPVVVRADSADAVKAALARPEVACALVPADRADLLDLDLTELTYGR
jgi:hypothetical protein